MVIIWSGEVGNIKEGLIFVLFHTVPGIVPGTFFFFFFFNHHFYFPAQLLIVGGFTISDLLDKRWSQVSSLLPPGTRLQFLSRIGFSIPTARRFSSNFANSRSRAFR